MAVFEQQFLGKNSILYLGQLVGREISGTWFLDGLKGTFQIAHSLKTWKGHYKTGETSHDMIINHLNIYPPKITGRGTDEVGDYTISGELKPDNTTTFVK